VSSSTAASGVTVANGATATATSGTVGGPDAGGTGAVVVRRWWNDCFVNNKLHWRERAVIGQLITYALTHSVSQISIVLSSALFSKLKLMYLLFRSLPNNDNEYFL